MKVFRLANLVLAVLLLSWTANGYAAESPHSLSITILHVNDLHGHIQTTAKSGGAAYLAGLVEQHRSADPGGTVLLAAGDMFQGTPISNVFRGKPVVEIMNRLKFDAVTLGNHEFDWGWPELLKIMEQASSPYLAANLVNRDMSRPPKIKKSILLERKGVKIAVIGIITPETAFTTNPRNVEDFKFLQPESVLPKMVRVARAKGAKLIIVLSHCGLERDVKIARRVQGIDVIIGGHSHTAVTPPLVAGKTIIAQAGSNGLYLGVLKLEIDGKSGRVIDYSRDNLKSITASPGSPFDPEIEKIVSRYSDSIKNEFSRIVGESGVDLLRNSEGESNLGNLICDAMRSESGAEIAFYNSGGIRANIYHGKVRLEQAFEALPFDNVLVSMDLTGEQVKSILEKSASMEIGILQVSGLKYKINASKPKDGRVEDVTVNGSKLQPAKVYRIVTNDFLAAGGDRFLTFKEGKNIVYGDDVRESFIRYLEKRSPVAPRVEGRIVIAR